MLHRRLALTLELGELIISYGAGTRFRTESESHESRETWEAQVQGARAWVLTRRIAHSAHHRGQLTTYLRLLGRDLYSTYGPTANTGGLLQQSASVIYRYRTVEELLAAARGGAVESPRLPGPGSSPPTERPG